MTVKVAPSGAGGNGGVTDPAQTIPTVKGVPINQTQAAVAKVLLGEGQKLNAPGVALAAIIYAGMGETSLGNDANTYQNNGQGYWGVLQGSMSTWPNPHDVAGMARSFFQGGKGFQGGGAIHLAKNGIANVAQIAVTVEVPSIWPIDKYATEWSGGEAEGVKEAKNIVQHYLGGGITFSTAGGAAGLGGSGTSANSTPVSPWLVGTPTNPDQDYWTTINQYAQNAQWYAFSDGEYLYVADGIQLMGQTPALVIHRQDSRVVKLELTWDNTTFTYAATYKKQTGIQRRATLARTTSPTEATLWVICDIDAIRGGDVVYLLGAGPGDGPWLVGDCTRSMFSPYSQLTLVQAMMSLSAASGNTIQPNSRTGRAATVPGAGTVIKLMISYATTIAADNYPYVWGGGHTHAGFPSIGTPGGKGYDGHTVGFDCSGAVGAVLAYANAGLTWNAPVPGDSGIISQLRAAGLIYPGQGSGPNECTLFDNPGVHIYMRINGRYWGTWAGGSDSPGGGGWCNSGYPMPGFNAYHFSPKFLGEVVAGTGVIG